MKKAQIILTVIMLFIFIILTVPASASLPTQDKSCTEGFVGGDTDGDGKVTASDASELIRYITGWTVAGDASHADTLRDGVINAKDASKLMQYLAGWNVGRLCHDDEYVVVKESTVMEQGKARHICRVCGDFVEETLPYRTYTVCGTDITEYHVLYGVNGMSYANTDRIVGIMNATCDQLLGGQYDVTEITSKSKSKKAFEHEILVGDVSQFERDGLPDFSNGQPCYGVTEDGTVYFNTTNTGLLGDMWLEMLRDRLDVDFHLVNNVESLVHLVSYSENGGDIQPFSRTYDLLDLDAEGYKLVFEDEFDGDSLDWDIWKVRGKKSRAGYYSTRQIAVYDGKLHLTASYLEDGEQGPGWYSMSLQLKKLYSRGYYEAKIDCSDYNGFWSAFWIQGQSPYDPEKSHGGLGPGGCEIDIMELFGNRGLTYNLYSAGGIGSEKTDAHESYNSDYYNLGDIDQDFHVFAVEWDEDYYTFYVDGRMVGRTDFADGTSSADEMVCLTLCITDTMPTDKTYSTEMVIDYLRIYQK